MTIHRENSENKRSERPVLPLLISRIHEYDDNQSKYSYHYRRRYGLTCMLLFPSPDYMSVEHKTQQAEIQPWPICIFHGIAW